MTSTKQLFALLIITAAPLLWGCSSDDDDEMLTPRPEGSTELTDRTNNNANSTAVYADAARMEIPRLAAINDNLFLVKRVPTYGVNFCIEWDIAKKAQRWTAFRWDASNSGGYVKREDNFIEDLDIPAAYRTTYDHYRGSGYTRGHICASADRWNSLDANRQTFLYSNMQPQLYSFNCGIWEKLEEKVRSWNRPSFRDTLYVVKGGTIDHASDILEYVRQGTNLQLLVPKYFFMAILCKNGTNENGGYKAIGFYLEHRSDYIDEKNLSPYICSIDELEELTNIDFFCNLPDYIEDAVEATVVPTAWGFH